MKRLAKATWQVFVGVFIAVVLVDATVRLLLPWVDDFKDELQVFLSNALQTTVTLTSVKESIYHYNPAVIVTGIRIYQRELPVMTAVEIDSAILQLDTVASIRSLSLVFNSVTIDGAKVRLTFNDGQWGVAGFPNAVLSAASAALTKKTVSGHQLKELKALLSRQESIHFRNVYLQVSNHEEVSAGLMVDRLTVDGSKAQRYLSGRLVTDGDGQLDFDVMAEGPLLRWPDILLRGYLKVEQLNIKPWLPLFGGVIQQSFGLKINQLRMDTEIQGVWNNGEWQLSSDLSVPLLDLDWRERQTPPLTKFSTQWHAKGDQESWQAWLNGWQISFDGLSTSIGDIYLSSSNRPEWQMTMATETLSLQQLKPVLDAIALPGIANQLVKVLNPRGKLKNLALRIYPDRETFDFDLAAVLDNVGVDAWGSAPSGDNVSGTLRMTAWEGMLDLDSRDLVLGLDNVFDDKWRYEQVTGRLYWRVREGVYRLRADRMHVVAEEGDINARLRLDVPFDGTPVTMALEAGIHQGYARYAKKYLPTKIGISDALVQWLKAGIRGADIKEGAFIWNGPLMATAAPNDMSWGLFFAITDGELMYGSEWPTLTDITGRVLVDQEAVEVTSSHARLYDKKVATLSASVPDLSGDGVLELKIQASMALAGTDGLKFLRDTPIADAINHAADNWALDGALDVQLELGIPLSAGHENDINVTLTTENARFSLLSPAIDFQNIAGKIHYSTEKGLYATGLQSLLYEKGVTLDIHTDVKADTVRVGLSGTADIATIQTSFGQDWSPWIQGKTSYGAEVIRPAKGAIRLDVSSDLKGVTIPLPAPLGKTVNASESLKVSVVIPEKGSVAITAILNREITSLLRLNNQGLQSGLIYFGKAKPKLPETGFQMAGELQSLDLTPWYHWWQGYRAASTGSKKTATKSTRKMTDESAMGLHDISVSDFSIKQLRFNDYSLGDARFSMFNDPRGRHLRLTSPMVTGKLTLPLDNEIPLTLNIEQLVLPESLLAQGEEVEPEPETAKPKADPLAGVNPNIIPAMNVTAQDIRMGAKTFGNVSLAARKTETGIILQELQGTFSGLSLKGSLDWNLRGGKFDSHYKGTISSGDLGLVLAHFGHPDLIETRKSLFTTDVVWAGSPADFNVETMKGQVGIDIKDGRFLSDDSKTGALRIFGIMNMETITRRLKLDFSDLFSSGITYDRIKGVTDHNEGLITFAEPLEISGPSSSFKLGGMVDLLKQTLDMELVVTLPVTENLPLISLLLGQPQIAGAIYLFDKIWGKNIERLASVHYEIKGPFDNPVVKLDKLFSNKVKTQ